MPSKVYGKNFGLYDKLAMGVFPLCVPYVNKVIRNLFTHFGRYVYVKLKLYTLFGERGCLYCGLADTLLNYINQKGQMPPSGRSLKNQWWLCYIEITASRTYTSLLVGMPNFNRKSVLIPFFIPDLRN